MSISRKMVKWWSSPTCNHEKENSRTDMQSCPRHTVRYRKQVKKYELWPPSVKKKPLLFFTQIRLISAGDGWKHAYQCSFWRVHVLSWCFNFSQTRITLIINFKNETRQCRWKEGHHHILLAGVWTVTNLLRGNLARCDKPEVWTHLWCSNHNSKYFS